MKIKPFTKKELNVLLTNKGLKKKYIEYHMLICREDKKLMDNLNLLNLNVWLHNRAEIGEINKDDPIKKCCNCGKVKINNEWYKIDTENEHASHTYCEDCYNLAMNEINLYHAFRREK